MGDQIGASAGDDSEMKEIISMHKVMHALREALISSAIKSLKLPQGSRGLDAGCGIGLQAMMLAEDVGPSGHVTGLDLSRETATIGRRVVKDAGMERRISFEEGDVSELPFDNDSFDWAWSMDCIGYMPVEPVPLIRELVRVVSPGGGVAILAWSSEQLLPGYPKLEAHLDATTGGIAPYVEGKDPGHHFLRTLNWFEEAGVSQAKAQTYAGDVHAPMSTDSFGALEALIQMRWPGAEEELSEDDWAQYQRLCHPESPEYILNLPDYYAFFTYSMFSGIVKR